MMFTITKNTLTKGLEDFFKKAGITGKMMKDNSTADFKARQAVGIQLLSFVVLGSGNESTVPPIRWGVLRGSGSVFVDGVMVGDSKAFGKNGTPNREYSESKKGMCTIGFNTAYASRWHENKFTPGGKRPSKQAINNPAITANVDYKYLERHLIADKETLLGLYCDIFKKEMGM